MKLALPGWVRVLALVIGVPVLAIWFSRYTRSAERNRVTATVVLDSSTTPVYDATFWSMWGDGQAELSAYDLTYTKYGAPRQGVAIAIFVTETFSNRARVKADPGKHPASDEFPVMKLNLVKDYQTGVYDYNEMLSAFVALAPVNARPAGLPAKVSFSSQEWCGHVYEQLLFDARTVRHTGHSYFDGEGDRQREFDYPAEGISEDSLLLWARGMARPAIAPGESRNVPLLMSLAVSREAHKPLVWRQATLSRAASPATVSVPAGTFAAEAWTAEIDGASRLTFLVEAAGARRVIQWESSRGEKAQLLGSNRMKYWELNKPGGEGALKKLGISPRPRRTS